MAFYFLFPPHDIFTLLPHNMPIKIYGHKKELINNGFFYGARAPPPPSGPGPPRYRGFTTTVTETYHSVGLQ